MTSRPPQVALAELEGTAQRFSEACTEQGLSVAQSQM